MHALYTVAGFMKALADLFRNHYRAMLPAGATRSDRQVALSFVNVVGKKINQKVGNALNKFLRLRK